MQNIYIASSNPEYDPFIVTIQNKLNTIRRNLLHNLPPITMVDGKYGYETARVVSAFQDACEISVDGKLGPVTIGRIEQKMRELPSISSVSLRETYISATKPKETYISAIKPRESYITALPDNKLDLVISIDGTIMKTIATVSYNVISKSVGYALGIDEVLQKVIKEFDSKKARLSSLFDYVADNRTLGKKKLQETVTEINKILVHINRYGKSSKLNGFSSILNRNNVLQFMEKMFKQMSNCKFVITSKKIIAALKPITDFLNKIPGLKYLGVIEKICKGTKQMFSGNFEKAFDYYLDGLRELLEQLLVDALVFLLVASGFGIIAFLFVILIFIVDYFFFSDNAGDSLADKYTNLSTRNVVQDSVAPYLFHKVNK